MATVYSRTLSYLLFAALLAVAGSRARACGIPVFRYALERWPASPYAVVLLHRGALTGVAAAAAAQLRASAATASGANLRLVTIDLATTAGQAEARRVCPREPAALPWMLAFAPERRQPGQEVWSGPLTMAAVRDLIDSPRRRDLARRLLGGDSAVWILLESGDKTRDDKAAAELKGHLATVAPQCEARIKAAAAEAAADGPAALPPPIRFSMLRVARTDPAEAALRGMLLGAEDDLKEYKEPIVFAVMGRGRLLPALVGKGINLANVSQLAMMLTGDCTCEVKDEIPGTDLLLKAAWEKVLMEELAGKSVRVSRL